MKLEPRAKPVRFQITFGNLEINSIEDLKRLSIKEVYTLFKEGTLEKFLEQKGDTQRLRDVREFKPTGESVGNYIRLIGLINSDLSNCLKSVKSLDGWKTKEIDGILKSLSVDTLKQIYKLIRKDREEDGEEEKGIWKEFWKGLITKENITKIFSDQSLRILYSNSEWGEIFASKVDHNRTYKRLFNFIKESGADYTEMLQHFYYACYNENYHWGDAFYGTELKELKVYFSDEDLRKLIKDEEWKKAFKNTAIDKDISKKLFFFLFGKKEYILLNSIILESDRLKGLEWKPILASMSLNDLLNVYQEISVLQKSDRIKWGEIFAKQVPNKNDWETINSICKVLTPEHEKSFQEVSGFNPDPWAGFSSLIDKKRLKEIDDNYKEDKERGIDNAFSMYRSRLRYFFMTYKNIPLGYELLDFEYIISDLYDNPYKNVYGSYNDPDLKVYRYDLNKDLSKIIGNNYRRKQTLRKCLEKIIERLLSD